MTDRTRWLNGLTPDAAREQFCRCCGATWWCDQMAASRPFADERALATAADAAFDAMPRDAWLEAFTSHPKIGDVDSLRMKFAGNKEWSGGEQAGVSTADEATIQRLADGNDAYAARFGYLFIVCATGKSATEMLAILEGRLGNDDATEFSIAAGEQRKITHLRLAKLEPQ
ncbi:Uric acid degradation bifunctional protein PucL [Botrimarina colliarenosi]|uniref:2-oxo-4-hydroxy-4-carboxy-5-ureidoimidazoline decarboxylase n=1 Tax=Botrimarina colliarenosi TaxID=2528001 RepID=A0A5C6AFR4_9BACT|nr:2-oxo-4-hydroxy-4-carboxy-5-ureidoimidazoline decarboxylase [Botrimarina colliarenosi]TWT97901.1 Uric acid degradation bifunctional protein PucL [Botrimarina colliarenosi]